MLESYPTTTNQPRQCSPHNNAVLWQYRLDVQPFYAFYAFFVALELLKMRWFKATSKAGTLEKSSIFYYSSLTEGLSNFSSYVI